MVQKSVKLKMSIEFIDIAEVLIPERKLHFIHLKCFIPIFRCIFEQTAFFSNVDLSFSCQF